MALDVADQQVTEDLEVDKKEMADLDELDFSDMDKIIDDEEAPESEDMADEDAEELELDFDLDITPETERAKEDLKAKVDQEEPGELDLSDLENLLDEEEAATSDSAADETVEDLDLKLGPKLMCRWRRCPRVLNPKISMNSICQIWKIFWI